MIDATPAVAPRPTAKLNGRPLRPGHAMGLVEVDPARRRSVVRPGPSTHGSPVGYIVECGTLPDDLAEGSGPVVGELETDSFRVGDHATLNGTSGGVTLQDVERVDVVTSFLERPDRRILLLLRSERVGSFRGRWAGVSGFLEGNEPERQARQEILEETGITGASLALAARGRVAFARDRGRLFAVHPFRFRVPPVDVRLDWEHSSAEWVDPGEIRNRPTVPGLDRVWERVAPSNSEPATPR